MKMRTLTSRGSSKDDIDADLKWVEENIPSSSSVGGGAPRGGGGAPRGGGAALTSDTAFPSFPMDSDEEVMQTKFEMSKME